VTARSSQKACRLSPGDHARSREQDTDPPVSGRGSGVVMARQAVGGREARVSQRDEFIAHALRVAAASSSRPARVAAAPALGQKGSRRDRLGRQAIERALNVATLSAPARCALADGLVALASPPGEMRSSTILVRVTPSQRERLRQLASADQVDVAELLVRRALHAGPPRRRQPVSGALMPP
jgi:hypothetical protein